MKKVFYLLAMFAMPVMAQQSTTSGFEDTTVEFNEKGYWNGGKIGTPEEGDWGEQTYHCTAVSGLLTATCNYSTMDSYDWWGGVALSMSTSSAFANLDDQYNNVVGAGASGTPVYGVIYGNDAQIDVNVEGGAMVKGLYVTNSAYTHNNFTINTGSLDTKFTAAGDHINLDIVATKADGTTKTQTVVLAEYTDEGGLTYINNWKWVDLTDLGTDVTKLTFNFDCNKPMVATYACIDQIEVVTGISGVATFENLTLAAESYWNGTDDKLSFVSGQYKFENGHEVYVYPEYNYDYCYGFYYTNMTSTTFGGDYTTEQYKSCVGHGADNSANYATYNVNDWTPKYLEVLGSEDGDVVKGFYVTNAASAYTAMTTDGIMYGTRKFGEGDWFMLTVTGYDAEGNTTGTKDFYLADLRDADKAYIINDWRYVDLSGLGKVKKLGFTMSSSDNGEYGMNTPAYFCVDNVGAEGTEELPGKNVETAITLVQQGIAAATEHYNLNGVRMQGSQRGLNIVRMDDGSVRKVMVK